LEPIRTGLTFETGYLTSKGRIIDRILVMSFLNDEEEDSTDEAFLITSPGNSGSNLYDDLAPLVFPMDQVTLTDCTSSNCGIETSLLTLACSKLKDAKNSFSNNVAELLFGQNGFNFPSKGVCSHYKSKGSDVYLFEHAFLSTDACHGYSMLIEGDGLLSNQVWGYMTAEQNDRGPVGVGSLEYETLRIEAGLPGYGYEMTGDGPKRKKLDNKDSKELDNEDKYISKSNPLELHLQHLVDTEKGCYQGQEGVASMMKNPRGSPRML
jgi:folate-binding Fe-S cluster repair protein YgfZ